MPKYRYNRYRDLEIDVSRINGWSNPSEFADIIADEYRKWADRLHHSPRRHMAVMWLNVPVEFSSLLEVLLTREPRFSVHHANRHRFMLVKAYESRTAQIPSYGTHYVKVECVVVERGTNKILAVRERIDRGTALYKLVTGSVETGEFIGEAAMREIREETGIRCELRCITGCGNRQHTRFDRDEIIVGCLLVADQGQQPRGDGLEVAEAVWMPAEDFQKSCTAMSQRWLTAALNCDPSYLYPTRTADVFRGAPHMMDFFVSQNIRAHPLNGANLL